MTVGSSVTVHNTRKHGDEETRNSPKRESLIVQRGNIEHKEGIQEPKKLTEQNGAFKHRTIREERDTPGISGIE